jgi:exopolyphosphatase/guanosine-5'-triphosphate,3'-diphosphate pyrophosphatase
MELEPVISRYQHYNWDEAIGASGTIRAVIKIAQANGWAEHRITLESMQHIIDTMCEAAHIDQLQLKGLDPERAPVFPGGIIILYATFKALGIKEMRVADGALREGLIHDQLGRFHDEDVRSKSVSSLAQRYHVDKDQVTRVQHTVRNCFEQVANNWKLDEENHLQWLLWAVELYEIGMDIAHSHHQKHSAYIIENTDLAGFSRQEQSVLASLVLAHRRKFPLKTFKRLSTQWKKVAQRLAILLRLATVLHRSHTDIALPEFTLKVNGKLLQLSFENHWLDEHQLTLADLQQEAIYLENTGYKLELNDV